MSIALQDPQVQPALARAAVYQTLAMGFAYPVPEAVQRFAQVASLVRTEAGVLTATLTEPLEAVFASSSDDVNVVDLAAEHTRLFSDNVMCTPYETEYETDPFSKSRQLADVVGFYRAWGMGISEEHRMMGDFVGTETEFMALLCRKEAHAAVNAWDDRRELAVDAQRAFLESHLGRWSSLFAGELRTRVRPGIGDHYARLADLLERFVIAECALLGAEPKPLRRRMVSANDAQLPMCDPKVVGTIPQPEE